MRVRIDNEGAPKTYKMSDITILEKVVNKPQEQEDDELIAEELE